MGLYRDCFFYILTKTSPTQKFSNWQHFEISNEPSKTHKSIVCYERSWCFRIRSILKTIKVWILSFRFFLDLICDYGKNFVLFNVWCMYLVFFMLYNLGRVKLTILSSILATIRRQHVNVKRLNKSTEKRPSPWYVLDFF